MNSFPEAARRFAPASHLADTGIGIPGDEVTMRRQVRMAALAISAVLVLGTIALAQDADDYYRRGNAAQARQYGYDNGFRDGEKRGRHEGHENDPYDYHTPDWRQATHGYKGWMGPVTLFQNAYQQGYAEGFRSGFEAERPRGRSDEGYRGNGYSGGSSYSNGSYGYDSRVGYNTGYQDGVTMAREDLYNRKPFNPNPRARFGGRDDGYQREYGDKNAYKAQYTDGYIAGYQGTFHGRY
jgi:hypothetical protein